MYADLILPLAVPQLYTYSVPETLKEEVEAGKRVVVQFGKRKLYTAIIKKIHDKAPLEYKIKPIISVIDEYPIINEKQFKLWTWIAEYYVCSLGEIYKAAVPAGLKLESETILSLNPDSEQEEDLSEKEKIIYKELENKKKISIKDINKLLPNEKAISITQNLIQKKVIIIDEKLKETYKPKYETYVKLCDALYEESEMHATFNKLSKAPKQLQLLMAFIQMSDFFNENINKEVSKKELIKKGNTSHSIFKTLENKKIFETYKKETGRLERNKKKLAKPHQLTYFQADAYESIKKQFEEKDVVLLHGITASGKTEVYIQLINKYIEQGQQVLYLLPEIAITTQIIERLRMIFGNKVGIYHSKFNDAERVEIWNNVLAGNRNEENGYKIILGVRSSIFMPFSNLGLIIVDEEHENSYKQYNPAPRYNARDTAIVLSRIHSAKVLLGTATPSFESYYNTQIGKYALSEIKKRYKEIEMPEIIVADTRKARKQKRMKSIFSDILLENMEQAVNAGEQIILFQNRRGFSPFLECNSCGWIPYCEFCDVSLTYHKHNSVLKCHYCGYSMNVPKTCLACNEPELANKGFGTERIEDELSILFPNLRLARMDLDTTKNKKSYHNIINDFEQGTIDVLIGTQMITKGLDFSNVSVVGIMNANNMLNFPDFRAFERSFQLMQQVSGRAGRKHKRGKVIIQTSNAKHPVIHYIKNNDFDSLYISQMNERYKYKYPPFIRLININIKHKKSDVLDIAAEQFAIMMRKIFAERVLGPEYPPVSRIQNYYQKNMLLKIEKEKSVKRAKKLLLKTIDRLKKAYPSIIINPDIDPY